MRRFTLQLHAIGRSAHFELEAIHLDSLAQHIAKLAGDISLKVIFRHDSRSFIIYISGLFIRRARHVSMLHQSAWAQEQFCISIVNTWRQHQGLPPLPVGDGNRLPRPVEGAPRAAGGDSESLSTGADRA